MEMIFDLSRPGKKGYSLPRNDVPPARMPGKNYLRGTEPGLPSVSEPEVVRHFTNLSRMNFGVDSHFYPLGSCTMKYNPKILEKVASLESFASLHPLLPQLVKGGILAQGALQVIYELEKLLCEITGMDEFTTQPMAGAHGELTGVMLIAAYHREKGNDKQYIIIPDSGHGTNPASAAIAGYKIKTVRTDTHGVMDMDGFREAMDDSVAGVMLTCPNTLGVFNPHIKEISDIAHSRDALMYYDGANMNAIMGKARPGDLGFDIVHLNLHKTFATPHGGGGPGSGPVGTKALLGKYLPTSRVVKRKDGTFALDYDRPDSIGYISQFYGNYSVLLKAYAYILLLGKEGLIDASEKAVLNANYLKNALKDGFEIPFPDNCLHEFVISAVKQAEKGVRAIDIAKALIDRGIHPPTVYFPLNVKEALMVEPTETESRRTLDLFIKAMLDIADIADRDPEAFKKFPVTTPVGRLDEVKAARDMDVACL